MNAAAVYADPLEITTKVVTADSKTVYAKFELEQSGTGCMLTNKEGYEYYVNEASRMYRKTNQPELALNEQYGKAAWKTVKYYTDEACAPEDEITSAAEKALIDTASAIGIKITASGRTRVALHAPTALGEDFYASDGDGAHHGFGATLGNHVTFSVTITDGVASGLSDVFYAVNGTGAALKDESELADLIGTVQASWDDGTDPTELDQLLTIGANA